MIIVKITGGLGNQLFQYALGRALSLKLGCELVLDISFYPQQILRKYELNKFNIKARLATTTEITKAGGGNHFVFRLIRKLGLVSLFYSKYIKELEPVTYLRDIDTCQAGCYLDGCWQNQDYFKGYKSLLCDDLSSRLPISLPAEKWLDEIKITDSIGLHVRRGDYVTNLEANSVHGICGLDYYKKSVQYITEKVKKPVFYIFSDDINWCKENFDFIENKVFVSDTESAIDDLMLMCSCKHNVIANSSFSWWGAWLNQNKTKIVVSPVNWIKNNPNNLKWVPDTWAQL